MLTLINLLIISSITREYKQDIKSRENTRDIYFIEHQQKKWNKDKYKYLTLAIFMDIILIILM